MSKILLIVFITIFIDENCFAQETTHYFSNLSGLQYGFSLKAVVEMHTTKFEPKPILRMSADIGIGVGIGKLVLPSLNEEVQLYNGGFGSHFRDGRFAHFSVDAITALTLTVGFNNRVYANSFYTNNRVTPLYYFGDFAYPALQNPFSGSFSLGSNWIIGSHKYPQRVGFINFNFDRVQVSYYNDGGIIINQSQLGDHHDRYYTGGMLLSFQGYKNDPFNLVQLSYHKFTGYDPDAFEASNKLQLYSVNYIDQPQQDYNKSLWRLNIANPFKGYGVNYSVYNSTKFDFQHFIHWNMWFSYHLVRYPLYHSLSAEYYGITNNTGL